jgi:hypothetical protein
MVKHPGRRYSRKKKSVAPVVLFGQGLQANGAARRAVDAASAAPVTAG